MERFARAPDRLGPMYIYRALSQMSGVDCGKSLKFVYVHDWLSTLIQLFRTNESTALKSACSRRIGCTTWFTVRGICPTLIFAP